MPHFITKQGLNDLQDELKKLLEVDLPSTLAALSTAREDGDLKENAGYQTSLKVKDELTTRQQEIEEILKDHEIIDEQKQTAAGGSVVKVGSNIKIEYESSKVVQDIKIVGSSESDVLTGKISNESPLAVAILGKKAGQSAIFKSPNGKLSVKVIEIN